MENKLNSLLILIGEICQKGIVKLYQSDWLKIGLDYIETERLLQKLREKGVVKNIEPKLSSSKFKSAGVIEADFAYGSSDYNIPAFRLSIDEKRLEEELLEKQSETIRAVLTSEDGYGLFRTGNKSINVGLVEKVPYKLLEGLLPFGTIKRIDTVFKITNPITGKYSKDNGLNIKMKESILKDRLKELQRVLKREKVHVSLIFDSYKETVSMKYKSG
mgnify:CR=1 FL=1